MRVSQRPDSRTPSESAQSRHRSPRSCTEQPFRTAPPLVPALVEHRERRRQGCLYSLWRAGRSRGRAGSYDEGRGYGRAAFLAPTSCGRWWTLVSRGVTVLDDLSRVARPTSPASKGRRCVWEASSMMRRSMRRSPTPMRSFTSLLGRRFLGHWRTRDFTMWAASARSSLRQSASGRPRQARSIWHSGAAGGCWR
jgi:hypothetical protein